MLVRVEGICTDDSRLFELNITVDEEGFDSIRKLVKQSKNSDQCRRIQSRLDALQAELDELRK